MPHSAQPSPTLSATTLADPRVLALNAANDAVTLTDAQVTDAIIGKFDTTDNLTLHASGATVAALSGDDAGRCGRGRS